MLDNVPDGHVINDHFDPVIDDASDRFIPEVPLVNQPTLSAEDTQREAANVAKLPERCYVFIPVNPVGRRIGIVARGETGYYPYDQADGDKDSPISLLKDVVLEQNRKLGVTPAQMEAMYVGSMCGFHVPGADPDSPVNVRMGEVFVQEAASWSDDLAQKREQKTERGGLTL